MRLAEILGAGRTRRNSRNATLKALSHRDVRCTEKEAHSIFETVMAEDESALTRLLDSRTMIELLFDGSRSFNSMVLAVNEAQGFFVVDEPVGGMPDRYLRYPTRVTVEARLQGHRISLTSTLTASGIDNKGRRFHKLSIPKKLRCRPRRAYRRIPLPATSHIAVRLYSKGRGQQAPWTGELIDVSAGGFGAVLRLGGAEAPPELGDQLPHCVLSVGAREVSFGGTVCFISIPSGDRRRPRVGVRFSEGPRPDIAARLLAQTGLPRRED